MGGFCSCLRGKHSEEETVDVARVEDQTLYLLPSNNRANNVAEYSEPLPVPVTRGGPNSSTNHIANFNSKSSEEDVCPTCFEGYTNENPKIIANCNHHYHLGCIYDWMERSKTCPACGQVMDFAETA